MAAPFIREIGKPERPALLPQESPRFDVQDGLIAAGVVSAETAAAAIWWPAALILLAVFCFAGVYLIELEKKRTPKAKERE